MRFACFLFRVVWQKRFSAGKVRSTFTNHARNKNERVGIFAGAIEEKIATD